MDRRRGIGILGQRQGMPRWEDDPMWRRNRLCHQTGQEEDSPLEVSIMEGEADMGDGNNNSVTISDRA